MGKEVSSVKGVGKRMKLGPYFTSYTKINSMWIKDLNIRSETMGCLGVSVG